jgi:metal-responsive CopG/Arc/MetJ family transcriptional regulator
VRYDHTIHHIKVNMPATERVTVTLPAELVQSIDRLDRNRSHFIGEAVRQEIHRRCHEELLRSLEAPHAESLEFAKLGIAEWSENLMSAEDDNLVAIAEGTAVRWDEETGWVEDPQ